jgi:hypothetical protein
MYAVQCFGGVAVGALVFVVAARLLGMSELADLLTRGPSGPDDGEPPPAAATSPDG